jgi:HK97 family phage prohead protease
MQVEGQETIVIADAARCMLIKQINMSNFYNKKSVEGAPIDMEDSNRTIMVYYSAFGNVDSDGDIITPGAFTKTLKENGPQAKNRVWHLMNHSTDKPIAKPFSMQEDAFGLKAQVKLPNTTLGNDLYELYKAGHITEHSIGFQTVKSQSKGQFNEITEIKLYEGSSVLWGANANTPTVSVKAEGKPEVIDEINKTIKSLRTGNFTDATFELLELRLKQLQQYLSEIENESSIIEVSQPLEKALEEVENPNVKAEMELVNYLQSFKIFN